MNGFTICRKCNHRVCTAPGFCEFCGELFPVAVILRQVAAKEIQDRLELEWHARVVAGKSGYPRSIRESLAA